MNIYEKYVTANKAKEFFKQLIIKLDESHKYYKISSEPVYYVSEEDLEKYKIENYEREIQLIKNEIKEWRAEHKDYYRIQPCLPSSCWIDHIILSINTDNINITLEEAVQGYKKANEELKKIQNSDLDEYCTETKPMLNYEHKEEYNKFVSSLYEKYNVPTDSKLKEILPKTIVKNPGRLSLDRSPCINPCSYNSFFNIVNNKIAELR